MSLNLNKHGAAMQVAWRAVLSPQDPTDWALFGYEGTSCDLTVVGQGQAGFEEMKEDLNAHKIMYAFCRVDDPNTSLAKFVFIHWQGESAPGTRKGVCATHLRDITHYFHGAHVTINARNEDEVDEDEILAKVARASASVYNFKDKPLAALEDVPAPVGSNHQRIIPERELPKLSEREQFWEREQSEEKARIQTEKTRKISEHQQIEDERRSREAVDAQKRDALVNERERKNAQLQGSPAPSSASGDRQKWAEQQEADRQDEAARQNRGSNLARERNAEAKLLISQRSADAKAVFERNSSVGQLYSRKSIGPASPLKPPVPPEMAIPPPPAPEEVVVPPPASFGNEAALESPNGVPPLGALPEPLPEVAPPSDESQDLGTCAVALYDYQAADDTEISFDPNEVITNIEKIDPGWWQGCDPRGKVGLFPANYVEEMSEEELQKLKNSSWRLEPFLNTLKHTLQVTGFGLSIELMSPGLVRLDGSGCSSSSGELSRLHERLLGLSPLSAGSLFLAKKVVFGVERMSPSSSRLTVLSSALDSSPRLFLLFLTGGSWPLRFSLPLRFLPDLGSG
eukprot:maker-scaffold25_size650667-snap-gene-0.21 protein:Tk06684 transcript:maker-scaffold25_size650667-snap-gene-0.21-mRNA-1 annotation:"drebrin-like protein"